ncbi:MAG: hypothetical protein V7459_03990 [Oceanicoccus sp.]
MINELQRLAYLEAMGVDAYTPRLQLPGALASQLCAIPVVKAQASVVLATEPVQSVQSVKTPVMTKGHAAAAHALFDDQLDKKIRKPAAVISVAPVRSQQTAQDSPQFSLSIVRASNILIIDGGLEGHINPQDYLQLLHNMLFALGAGKQQLSIDAFVWPMNKNNQIDQGEIAARQTLEAFLAKQAEQMSRRYFLVMGDVACRYVSRDPLPVGEFVKYGQLDVQLICTQSASQMLTEPDIKREVWRDLSPLYRVLKQI